jgi:SAM-dependent methyltransferase
MSRPACEKSGEEKRMSVATGFTFCDGIYTSCAPVLHREEEYPSHALDSIQAMQMGHFWYRGRHRFLLHAVHRYVEAPGAGRMIDLGGGCGGWCHYLMERARFRVRELAVADSSLTALRRARMLLPPHVACYQLDVLGLPWENRWDTAFLLDVLEHLPRHEEALHQIHRALRPGGILFVTTPALPLFWSWQDEAAGHQRRYTRRDFRRLAAECGFELLEARYFMFFLSPLYVVSRLRPGRRAARLPPHVIREWLARACRPPPRLVNTVLGWTFAMETPLGHVLPFPWGTSLLGVFRKPRSALAAPVKQAHSVAVGIAEDHIPIALGT